MDILMAESTNNNVFVSMFLNNLLNNKYNNIDTLLTEVKKIRIYIDYLLKKIDSNFEIKKLRHFDPIILQIKGNNLRLMNIIDYFIVLFKKCKERGNFEEIMSIIRNIPVGA